MYLLVDNDTDQILQCIAKRLLQIQNAIKVGFLNCNYMGYGTRAALAIYFTMFPSCTTWKCSWILQDFFFFFFL